MHRRGCGRLPTGVGAGRGVGGQAPRRYGTLAVCVASRRHDIAHGGIMVDNPVAFQIGPLAVRWYGILIMLGVLAGAYLAASLARRKGEHPDHLWNMVPFV